MIQQLKIKLSNLFVVIAGSAILIVMAIPAGPGTFEAFSTFVYPVMAPRMSSSFGTRTHPVLKMQRHHDGVDLAVPSGSPGRAVADGVVVYADPYGGYGNLVTVRHNDVLTTSYGHLQKISVTTGQKVKAGQIIGLVGETGIASGPHLHFEIRVNGKALNPERLIPDLASKAEG